MHFERHYKIIFVQEKLKKNSRFHQSIYVGVGYHKHRYFFYLALAHTISSLFEPLTKPLMIQKSAQHKRPVCILPV